MNLLSHFLEKYKNFKPTDTFVKNEFITLLKDEIGIELTKEDIRLSRNVIYIKASSVVKSMLSRRKEYILEKLNTQTKHFFKEIK